uniref:ZP domain-containing protein n=1 Tax=Acrobeloides nanus TaxID=290746 RepID=A0A914D0V6_9BILA
MDLLPKLHFPSWSSITQFEIPLNENRKCAVNFNKETGVYWLQLEVHEHRLLILEQDRLFNVTCDRVNDGTVSGAIGSGLNGFAGDQRLLDATNGTVEISSSLDPEVDFDLSLFPVNSNEVEVFNNTIGPSNEHDVSYGKSYDLKISIKNPDDAIVYGKLFRAHSCFATGVDVSVELVNSHGCTIDKHLLSDFVYEKGTAKARIPSMFNFPESKTMKLECSVAICREEFECKPNCDLKLDDPLEGEDAELLAVLKGTPGSVVEEVSGEEPIRISGIKIGVAQAKASTKVHVLDRRELPKPEASPDTSNFSKECYTPNDLLIMYKLCIGLCFIFFTGCCCNILFCCVCKTGKNKHQKRSAMPNKSHGSFATTNDLWISEPRGKPSMDESGFVSYGEPQYGDMRRSSLNSYASVKQRSTRYHDNLPSQFRMNSSYESPAHNGFISRPQGKN